MTTVLSRRSFFLTVAAIPALSPLASAAAGVAAPSLDIPEGWSVASFGEIAGKSRAAFPVNKRVSEMYFCDPAGLEFRVAQVRAASLPEVARLFPARNFHPHVYRSLRLRRALGGDAKSVRIVDGMGPSARAEYLRDPARFGEKGSAAYGCGVYARTTRATMDEVQGWKRIRANERFEDRNSDGTVNRWDQALFVNPSDPMDIRAVRIPRERI